MESLVGALQHNDQGERKHAADTLGVIKGIRAVEVLIVALRDNRNIRESVAYILSCFRWTYPQTCKGNLNVH